MDTDSVMRMAWKDPVLFMVCFLLLRSPLLQFVLYFSPLILSTVLCAIALMNVVPHETESELVKQICEGSQNADPSNEATGSNLRYCAIWLQWLVGMDRNYRICSDVSSTSQQLSALLTSEVPAGQYAQDYEASCNDEIIVETIAEIAVESETSSSVKYLGYSLELDTSIQELECREALAPQPAFKIAHEFENIFTEVQNLIRGPSKWLSLLSCMGNRALAWSRQQNNREEKLRNNMYHHPMLKYQNIALQIHEDSEQEVIKLVEDCSEKITLATEPVAVESSRLQLSQIGQLENSCDSIMSSLRDPCASHACSVWMEVDSSSSEETASESDIDISSLVDRDMIDTTIKTLRDNAHSPKEVQASQITEPKSVISRIILEEQSSVDASGSRFQRTRTNL